MLILSDSDSFVFEFFFADDTQLFVLLFIIVWINEVVKVGQGGEISKTDFFDNRNYQYIFVTKSAPVSMEPIEFINKYHE